jgi:Ni/Co efflux regulator RcnB
VRDYGYYRLRPPPRGYHWVRADNDYLLVAIATGVILDIALQ